MSTGYGNMDPNDKAAIDALLGGGGIVPPPGQPKPAVDDYAWLNDMLAHIDTLPIPFDVKIRYKQAWINYVNAKKIDDITPPDERSWRGTDKQVTATQVELNRVADDVKSYGPRQPTPETEESKARTALYNAQAANVGRPTPETPEDAAYKLAQTAKLNQGMANPITLGYQQYSDFLDELAKDTSKPQEQKQKLADLYLENLVASFEGTTPFDKAKQKQTLARNIMQDRSQVGSNLAQGLLSGITGAFGKIYSRVNPRYDYNIFDWANDYTNRSYGGAELNDLAKSVLSGALGGQQ